MKRTNGNYCHFGKWIASACAAAALLFAVSASAAQEVLSFDDVVTNFQDTIPNGYGGLNWVNFGAVDGTDYPNSGYQAGVISPDYVAFSFGTTNSTIVAAIKARPGHYFRLNSGYFTAAWNDGLKLKVIGKLVGRPTFRKTYTLSSTQPLHITFPRAILTQVTFIASGGIQNTNYLPNTGEHFAIDDLNVTVH